MENHTQLDLEFQNLDLLIRRCAAGESETQRRELMDYLRRLHATIHDPKQRAKVMDRIRRLTAEPEADLEPTSAKPEGDA